MNMVMYYHTAWRSQINKPKSSPGYKLINNQDLFQKGWKAERRLLTGMNSVAWSVKREWQSQRLSKKSGEQRGEQWYWTNPAGDANKNEGCQSRARGRRVRFALVSFLFLTQVCVLGSFSKRYLRVTRRVLTLPPVKLGVRKRREWSARGAAGRASPAVSLEGKKRVSDRSW